VGVTQRGQAYTFDKVWKKHRSLHSIIIENTAFPNHRVNLSRQKDAPGKLPEHYANKIMRRNNDSN
jgi:hypothetical protein